MTRLEAWKKADPAKLIQETEQLITQARQDYDIARKIVEMPTNDPTLHDMAESVLDGRPGEICATRMAGFPPAHAWPAPPAGGRPLIDSPNPPLPPNLYFPLVRSLPSGKT